MGYIQFVYCNGHPVVLSTFFCVSVAMHVTACDVRVTCQTNCTMIRYSLHKSTTIVKRIICIHSETTAHGAKEANVAISESLFKHNITFSHEYHVTMAASRPFSLCCQRIVDQTLVMRYSWVAKVGIESKRIVLTFLYGIKLKGFLSGDIKCGSLSIMIVSLFFL